MTAPPQAPEPVALPPRTARSEPSGAVVAAALITAGSVVVVALLTLFVRRNAGFGSYDWRILRDFRMHGSPRVVDASRALADLGSIGTLLVIAVIVGVLLRLRGLHAILCSAPLASLIVSGGLVEVLKVAVARVGPHEFRFGNHATGSFPSGHAADTTAVCVGLAIVLVAVLLRRPAERVVVFGLALGVSVAVGVSRLVLGVHWPTDVVAGWAVGLGTAVAIATLAVLATRDRPLVAPIARER